jgi:hypothetical protein
MALLYAAISTRSFGLAQPCILDKLKGGRDQVALVTATSGRATHLVRRRSQVQSFSWKNYLWFSILHESGSKALRP